MFKSEKLDGKLIVKPQGPITSTNANQFRDELREKVDAGEINIIIDLEAVDMIDSKGLSVFIICHQTLTGKGGSLTVVTDNEDLRGLFHVLRLDEHFTVTGSQCLANA